jgi:hypothetical protein
MDEENQELLDYKVQSLSRLLDYCYVSRICWYTVKPANADGAHVGKWDVGTMGRSVGNLEGGNSGGDLECGAMGRLAQALESGKVGRLMV